MLPAIDTYGLLINGRRACNAARLPGLSTRAPTKLLKVCEVARMMPSALITPTELKSFACSRKRVTSPASTSGASTWLARWRALYASCCCADFRKWVVLSASLAAYTRLDSSVLAMSWSRCTR
ncbi:hypothetical protein D3C86_506330 [compost metagenome]